MDYFLPSDIADTRALFVRVLMSHSIADALISVSMRDFVAFPAPHLAIVDEFQLIWLHLLDITNLRLIKTVQMVSSIMAFVIRKFEELRLI
jgi:hypothetical protein